MGGDESHFNVSVGSDKVTGHCPRTTIFLKRKESRSGIEPRSFRLLALPLGQTGSPACQMDLYVYNIGPWLVMQSGGARNTGKS